ncbi:MAG: hypothetical protein N2Z85_02050 [Patescibacteria group bacterium]|nr:hypothetical protein [Patescibacteria group bacterium]
MPNNLTAGSPIYWSAVAQKTLYKKTISNKITDFSVEKEVGQDGRALNKPYRTKLVAEEYQKGVALEAQDLSYNDDYLYIDQFYSLLMYVDDVDKIQNKYDTVRLWSEEAGKRISEKADAYLLYQGAANAGKTLTDGDFGGTTGNALALTTSNIVNVYGKFNEVLDDENVEPNERFIVVNSAFKNTLWQFASGKESLLGDTVGKEGVISTYAGLEHYHSNNLPSKLVWAPTANPSNNDTITINGVVITFKSTLSGDGEVKIGTNLAGTITNLVDFINNKGVGDNTNSKTHTVTARREIQNWSASASGSEVTIYVRGSSKPVYSSSNSSNPFSSNKSGVLILAGRKGAISSAFQLGKLGGIVDVEMASTVSAGKRGANYMPLSIFGAKVFNNSKPELVALVMKF